jgi:hypothetical protein
MQALQHPRFRTYFTAFIALAEIVHLAFEHFNGGIVSHHILNDRNLPSISNALGIILLPALAWYLSGRVQQRIANDAKQTNRIVLFFFGAMAFGLALSTAFTLGQESISGALFQGMLLGAIFLPLYRAEILLGFIFGMTYTFGAILPSLIGTIVALISMLFQLIIWSVLRRLFAKKGKKGDGGTSVP